MTARTAAIVLAAGRSSRFGANKLLAELEGRPILEHVLGTAIELGLEPIVVVVGDELDQAADQIDWRTGVRVVNETPDAGITSSLRIGLMALWEREVERVLVLLGDQPKLRADQASVVLAAATDPERPIVVPVYADGGNRNPVLLERSAWPHAVALLGDRGMAQVIAARPELVRYVDVPGANPDVDTPEDLARLA
jgi:molybdenum cofactor cytidylyltransferase